MEEEKEKIKMVLYRMENEGFHYCFKHYSNFSDIKDEKFHTLRKEYLKVSKELEDYLNDRWENLNYEEE
jgi:hypothetical protein